MKRFNNMTARIFIAGVLFLLSGCAIKQADVLYRQTPAFYSYIFGKIHDNKLIAESAADVYVSPASCQKVIIALLAYQTLGADYRYETKLYATRKHNKIHDIIISFAGDPTLKTTDFLRLLEPIKKSGITGRVFLDISEFKTTPHSKNIMLDDLGTEYAQPVSSINIDENLISVVAYSSKKGSSAILANNAGYCMDSEVLIGQEPSSTSIYIKNNRIQARGNINPKDLFSETKISPADFDYFIFLKIKQILQYINIKNKVIIISEANRKPTDLVLLNVVKSEFLDNIISRAIKKSDNFVFDALYLKIIHRYGFGRVKKWEDGDTVVKRLIKEYFKVDMSGARIVDGSGLSRYNQLQPRKLFMLLKHGYNLKEFVSALPSPGEPGSTLSKRTNLLDYVKAKTGNMAGISCLCGYGINKHPTAFVIITNSFAATHVKKIFPTIDKFVNRIIKERP
jgi:D-alanyl-D-alanine carboxypeptidase/D-alanyl-D-alanine-endopeptidase (penicillin-binding protein 4)